MRLDNIFLTDMMDGEAGFIPLVDENNPEIFEVSELPDTLPILPLRNMVLFPGVVMPVSVGRKKSLRLVREAFNNGTYIGVITQREVNTDNPKAENLYAVGTVAQVAKILEMPDGSTSVILQGRARFNLVEFVKTDPFIVAKITHREDILNVDEGDVNEALVAAIKDLAVKVVSGSNNLPNEATFAIKNIDGLPFLTNFISSNLPFKIKDKQKLLERDKIKDRSYQLLEVLAREAQLQEIKNDIQAKARVDIDQQQREYYLHQQMKTIQDELGGNPIEAEIRELNAKAAKKKWSKAIRDVYDKEVAKLERMNPAAADYSVQSNYVSTLVELPWDEYSKDNFNLNRAQKILDKDHYGLEKVKDRILEYLAVLKLKNDMKSPILCLVGPPGVGKTSLGKSIAKALDRKYVRMSLGGLHDEAEIRGHRKTYIGALPGRIIQNIKKAGTSNPVFILDEIDKVSSDFRGDPASALLEVLDPEQNNTFHDNYLEVEYDLSKVMFIATANTVASISQPLLDRMEVIDVSGYIMQEKVEIAKRHLVPRQMENHGLQKGVVKIPNKTLQAIVEGYTRESGVRELDKKLATLMRRLARKVANEEPFEKTLNPEHIKEYLGTSRFSKEEYQGNEYAGVVTGLAWTAVGGEILFVESSLSRGSGGRLSITGNLGDVMKESAMLALEYIKSHNEELGLDQRIFEHYNVHLHVPEGAIPKDGPSAGVTMLTSLVSSFTQRKVKKGLAMTGEITLRGKVLPVGGIKEKILAAKRSGITEIILCEENRKDLDEIKDIYIKGVKFHFVSNVKEVLDLALLKQKVDHPVKFDFSDHGASKN
ncbi:endopeptidase La [Saccharicrinis sp. FJH62]|uniref:endopeptidase La n=1 Tax=Saccharicrinis sp. FJH62 TaxID=3344657 RepID=UPI0035D482B1